MSCNVKVREKNDNEATSTTNDTLLIGNDLCRYGHSVELLLLLMVIDCGCVLRMQYYMALYCLYLPDTSAGTVPCPPLCLRLNVPPPNSTKTMTSI